MQDIYVGDFGKGIPLVLVHGFLGSSKMWELQIKFFKNYYRVLTPDLPGFGKSNKIKSYNNISFIAERLLKCLEKKKISKFHLLGHSMGGMIAQEMIRISPKKVLKLVLYSTGSVGEMPERFETVKQSRENLKKNGLKKTLFDIAKTWFIKGDAAKHFNVCIESGKATSVVTAENSLKAFEKWNGTKALKKIKNETLILWGNKDKSYKFKQIMILKNNIKNSKLEIVKNCAHNVHLEKPSKFNKIINNFLL